MIIISKYNDYYDKSVGYGVDKKIVYMRKQKSIELQNTDTLRKKLISLIGKENKTSYKIGNDTIRPFFIGFCGKIYRGYSYTPYSRNLSRSDNIYGFNKETFPENILFEKVREEYSFTRNEYTSLSEILDKNSFVKEDVDFFQENKLVSFFFEDDYNSNYIINPILSDFGFQKVMNSVQAFQEISMFISGVLGTNERDMITISDDEKVIKHGFNNRSFRKEPEKTNK